MLLSPFNLKPGRLFRLPIDGIVPTIGCLMSLKCIVVIILEFISIWVIVDILAWNSTCRLSVLSYISFCSSRRSQNHLCWRRLSRIMNGMTHLLHLNRLKKILYTNHNITAQGCNILSLEGSKNNWVQYKTNPDFTTRTLNMISPCVQFAKIVKNLMP